MFHQIGYKSKPLCSGDLGDKKCHSGEWQWAGQVEHSGEEDQQNPEAGKGLAYSRNGVKSFPGKWR